MISMLLFPLHLAGLQIFCPILILLFEVQQVPLLFILASLTLGSLFLKYINPALSWSITLTEIFMSPTLMFSGSK